MDSLTYTLLWCLAAALGVLAFLASIGTVVTFVINFFAYKDGLR